MDGKRFSSHRCAGSALAGHPFDCGAASFWSFYVMPTESKATTEARLRRSRSSAPDPEFIREDELRIDMLGGISPTTLRRMIKEDGFPAPLQLTSRSRVLLWNLAAVRAYLARRAQAAATVQVLHELPRRRA